MGTTKLKTSVVVMVATALGGGDLQAQEALAPKPASSVPMAAGKGRSGDSAAMAQTEATVARLRELIRPQPGEHVANMAKIAWQRDPWEAAVKGGREGKPVLAYGEGMHGVPCGFG